MLKAHVVVGGGLNGLMQAEYLQIIHPQHPVIIIESELEGGGLLRSFDYVDQRELPPAECSPLASFYPKSRGIQQVINVLVERLKAKGVQILCNQRIKAFKREGSSLTLQLGNGLMLKAEKLYWTANLLGLAHLTGVKVKYADMDKPLTNVLCHFMLEERPALADLYFLYCADKGFKSYRITNYHAFCPSANAEIDGFPVTMELLLNEEEVAAGSFETLALQEMHQMGIVSKKCKVHFAQAETLKYGFPRPTLANMAELRRIREKILAKYSGQLFFLGVGARDGLFFMDDVLRHTFAFIKKKTNGCSE